MARGVARRDHAAERDPTERGAAGDAGGIDHILELPDESVEAGVRVHPPSRAEVPAQRIAHDAEIPRQIAQQLARPLPASLERLHDHKRWTGPLIEHDLPTTDVRRPTSDDRGPRTEDRRPTTDDRP